MIKPGPERPASKLLLGDLAGDLVDLVGDMDLVGDPGEA